MTPMTTLEEVKLNMRIIQWHLINARMCNQEAQAVKEFGSLHGETECGRMLLVSLNRRAKGSKSEARRGLILMEKFNGRQWLNGEEWYPLKEYLNGKGFKSWSCYDPIYECSALFRGVDPS